jgi:thioredoxin reductase (NADPH)
MAKPVILTVDDDPVVLNAVERDLRQKYGRDYRIIKADSGKTALDALQLLQQRSETVALFVVDQRMPEMNGVQFLEKAREIFPDARKVLLTAYADTEAAINAINVVGLDFYLMKPWDPPQENLYPVIDSLLQDWRVNVVLPYDGIRICGTLWSPKSHDIKDFLGRNQVPYLWVDVEQDAQTRKMVESVNNGELRVPTLFFPDGTFLVEPNQQELAVKVGLRTHADQPFYDVVIIGGGPAGLSAAVYASADGLRVLLIERNAPGGQAGNSPKIENYLGFPAGITGTDLTRRAVTQATRFGAEILSTVEVTKIRAEGNTRIVSLSDGSEISCKMVLIATGAWFRVLPLANASKFYGAGIYYGAAHTEGAYYKDKDVVVIGGANSAAQGILYLLRFARKVTVLIRGGATDWSQYLDKSIKQSDKVEIRLNTEMLDVHGTERLERITLRDKTTGETSEMDCAAAFVFIGQKPQSDFVLDLVQHTPDGYLLTGLDLVRMGKKESGWTLTRDPLMLETSVPGVFAAGDVRNGTRHGVAAAIGDGDAAVSLFWNYLQTI